MVQVLATITAPHTDVASPTFLSRCSLKKHSDDAIIDYLLENGLGKAFKPWLSGSNHNLVRHNIKQRTRRVHLRMKCSYFTSANVSVESAACQ